MCLGVGVSCSPSAYFPLTSYDIPVIPLLRARTASLPADTTEHEVEARLVRTSEDRLILCQRSSPRNVYDSGTEIPNFIRTFRYPAIRYVSTMLPYDETPAGLYTRKSQDQPGVSDDEKSVARQIEQGKAYARKKGWVVLDEHIYVDDAITGAEFEKRTGLMRLLGSLSPKPPFKVLIMSEGSRFGRESFETPYLLKKVLTAGVEVWDTWPIAN